jgi:hypothetical protein
LNADEILRTQNETDKHVKSVYKQLVAATARGPVNYLVFVTHPRSFSQTIENIFFVAFLVRDRLARMSLGPDGQPYLGTPSAAGLCGLRRPCSSRGRPPASLEALAKGGAVAEGAPTGQERQQILELTMAQHQVRACPPRTHNAV